MPDDYYVSQYSGEEIDERLTAAHNAVRYDATQTLTDAQKTQARANIAAAPDGFGLGLQTVRLTSSDNLDNVTGNGWYSWGSPAPANAPTLIHFGNFPEYCAMFMIGGSQIVVSFNDRNNMAMRSKNVDGWTPWEYINPPLKLGVEYRTTERYLGKPVYVKLVDFGALPNNTAKGVGIASNMDSVISIEAIVYSPESLKGAYFTGAEGITNISAVPNNNSVWINTDQDLSATAVYCLCKYTKTTD